MDEANIRDLCSTLLSPIQEELKQIRVNIDAELLKIPEKINSVVTTLLRQTKEEFQKELAKRDSKIDLLEKSIADLKEHLPSATDKVQRPDQNPATFNRLDSWAQCSPFKDDRENNKEEKDLIILGDSIVRWVDEDRVLPGKKNFKSCNRGAGVIQLRNIFAEEIENKFTAKNIILHAGTNDIPAGPRNRCQQTDASR